MMSGLKWKLAIGFLLVFLAGVATGSFVWKWQKHPWHGRRADALAEHINERLRHELDLTPAQAAKIAPIVEESAKKLETIRRESARRVRQTFTDTNLKISPELTPEQRKKLAAMDEHHRRWRHRHRGDARAPEESPHP
jgi:Spy/CpxP family protein refolding chaperone